MSEIKARHIQEFLANAPVLPDLAPEPEANSKAGNGAGVLVAQTPAMGRDGAAAEDTSRVESLPTWAQEMQQARREVIALLTSPPAPDFRARMLRELVRFAAGVPAWQHALSGAGDKDQERASRRVRRLLESLSEALPQADLDRKTQSRLADNLAEASDRLYALSGQPEPTRNSEDVHE